MKEVKDNKEVYKKWWFWVIILLIGLTTFFCQGQVQEDNKKEIKYITHYEWNLTDSKIDSIIPGDEYKYVVLGVENESKDLKSGEYILKTNDNKYASFVIYVTDEYYEKPSEIPDKYTFNMVQGYDNSEVILNLKIGQYLYLCQGYNGQGKIYVNSK